MPFFKKKHYKLRYLFLGYFIKIFCPSSISSSIDIHYAYPPVFPYHWVKGF